MKKRKSKKSSNINVAIVGVGNCASALVQGVHYYSQPMWWSGENGLMHQSIGRYDVDSIKFVAAFDVDRRKIGLSIEDAIFCAPNCTTTFIDKQDLRSDEVCYGQVYPGVLNDSISLHMHDMPESQSFRVSTDVSLESSERDHKRIVEILKKQKVDVLINYLPVGSQRATEFYMQCALAAGCGVVNCIPVFIASSQTWANRFMIEKLPIIGDDIKSQFGATLLHRMLVRTMTERGVHISRTYQLNTGGNTDFLNMLNRDRLKSKKVSKTGAVTSSMPKIDDLNIHVGPSDYVPWQNDNKVCYLRVEGELFGGVPFNLEARLSVEDSPNSAGIVIDAIRMVKCAKDRKIGGVLKMPSAYYMKHPPTQVSDDKARNEVEKIIKEWE